jgi:hypothetical protein
MARNGSASHKQESKWTGDIEFAYISLTEAHVRDYETWIKNEAGNTEDLLDVATRDGYSVSISQDLVSDGFKCSFTTKLPKHVNSGICITSWSDNPTDAFYLNFWKTYILFAGQRAPTKQQVGLSVRR